MMIQPPMERSERNAFREFGLGGVIGKAEVEQGAVGDGAPRRQHHFFPPSSTPSLFDVRREARCVERGQAFAEQCAKHPMHQPPGPSVDQRQRGGDQRMIRRSKADLLGKCHAQHGPRLGIVGQPLTGRAVDQRIEIRQAAERFAGDGAGQRRISWREFARNLRSIVHRLPAAEHGIENAQRSAPGGKAFKGQSSSSPGGRLSMVSKSSSICTRPSSNSTTAETSGMSMSRSMAIR